MEKIELVAPAGGWDQLIAAINSGADSIYLGYRQFGARAYADNFSFKQLTKAASIAQYRGIKLYLTLNTILKDTELPEVLSFLNEYLKVCRDGIIIQDFGLYKMLSDLYKEIVPIHASTQMNTHNWRSLALLKDLSFKRAVLAREMTLDEIRGVKENSEIDLEVFGHGSQCYSYSGNCYFSSFIGGRSGNRGRCTQPCRMKFMLISKEGDDLEYLTDSPSYLLSKSDLSTLDIIPEIIKSGIKALKIEGRMKSPEYVAIVIKIYRKYIDLYYDEPEKYRVKEEDIYKLTQIFSRKLGEGYYNDPYPGEIISKSKSGSVGNFMGRIHKIDYIKKTKNNKWSGLIKSIQIKSRWVIRKGDILEVWTKKGNKKIDVDKIKLINKEDDKYDYSIGLPAVKDFSLKDRVFKSYDIKLDEEARSAFKNSVIYSKGPEIDKVKKENNILSNKKIGDYLGKFLDTNKKKKTEKEKFSITINVYDLHQLDKVMEADLFNIIYCCPIDLFNGNIVEDVSVFNSSNGGPLRDIIIDTPHMIYDWELKAFEKNIERLIEGGIRSYRITNPGILDIFRKIKLDSEPIKILIGGNFNTSNILSVEFFMDLMNSVKTKILGIEFSPEINTSEINTLIDNFKNLHLDVNSFLLSIFGHGFQKIMTARYHISDYDKKLKKKGIKTYIEDKKNYRFILDSDQSGNTMIYNSKKTCTIFDLDKVLGSGVNNLIIDGKFMEKDELLKVAGIYYNAFLTLIDKGGIEYQKYIQHLKDKELFKDYSRGHLFRGVE